MLFEKQQYQIDCVNNIVDVLKGINFKDIDLAHLQRNLKTLAQAHNYNSQHIPITDKLQLDVLMETGTGKTFTYLKTIFELNKKYGITKFIIVVPRKAIKLGVIQQINQTKEHFYDEYQKHLNFINYPESRLSTVTSQFIESTDLSILLTTNSAFNDAKNNINKKTEFLWNYGTTWQGIASKRPVVILDEPHLLKGKETTSSLNELQDKGSLFIRFGATYPKESEAKKFHLQNMVYKLDSISAFNQYLVKRIAVNTVLTNVEISALDVHNIKSKKSFDVSYKINHQSYTKTIRSHDDIGAKTGLDEYKGITVTKINDSKIFLSNQTNLEPSIASYQLTDTEIINMIRTAISSHFEKEERLFDQGIKVLSLFFIPSIADYREENPKDTQRVKAIFETEYKTIRHEIYKKTTNKKYQNYLDRDFSDDGVLRVSEGYFSGDRGKKEDQEAKGVDLILNKKEELLSFDTPLRFVFSVWALQEGWDNPNIFTICKLTNTKNEINHRQQVGRGLRIAVNQEGKRLTYQHLQENLQMSEQDFYDINTLDMVISGQERHFIQRIQKEIQEASFSIVGDSINSEILREKGLNEREIHRLLTTLEDREIIKFDCISDSYTIQSPILDFIIANRDQLSFFDDARYAFVKSIFATNTNQAVIDRNQRPKTIKIRQNKWKEFKILWETINKKSKIVYEDIEEQALIQNICTQFNSLQISKSLDHTTREIYDTQKDQIRAISDDSLSTTIAPYSSAYFNKQAIAPYILKFAKDEDLPLAFMIKLFNKLDHSQFKNNPHDAQEQLLHIIKEQIHRSMEQSVSYQFSQTTIFPNGLQDKSGKLEKDIKYSLLGQQYDNSIEPKKEFLYDTVVFDSKIEKDSIKDDHMRIDNNEIIVFAKLPKISIPTPYKTYNPDFAYVIKRQDKTYLFLVVETKGYKFDSDIPPQELQKIEYAKKFFKTLQDELPDIKIEYKTRINRQDLSQLVREIQNDT